jgi:hypothetical protein
MIEQPVSAAAVGTAEIDVICLNRKRNHGMLWECKSGRTIEEKQARVYAAVNAEDVQRTGNVTLPHPRRRRLSPSIAALRRIAKLSLMPSQDGD